MASEFAELWQFGSTKKRAIEAVKQAYPEPTLSICRFRQSEFGASETIKTVVNAMLDKSVSTLPQMALGEHALDERWSDLRLFAKSAAGKHKNADQWSEVTPSFQGVLVRPVLLLEKRAITTDTYLVNGESPLSSDAYGAIGPFATRAYLQATLSKKTGDNRIFVKPTLLGVRIWDDYDFKDFDDPGSLKSKILMKVFGRLTSQFLGIWNDVDTDEAVILQNSDFQSFRSQFMPAYNAQKPAPARQMLCQDFSAVSDFATRLIEGGVEYPLVGLQV